MSPESISASIKWFRWVSIF